jgi:hypothetical protein
LRAINGTVTAIGAGWNSSIEECRTVAEPEQPTPSWQVPALFVFAIVFLLLLLWIVFTHPNLSYDECMIVRVVLSLAAAGIGGLIPGLLQLHIRGLKAVGAVGFFVLVFFNYKCERALAPVPGPVGNGTDASRESAPPPSTKVLHDTDVNGKPYQIQWHIDPTCKKYIEDPARQCDFKPIQVHLPGNKDAFDQWNLVFFAPGPIDYLDCNPTGRWEHKVVPPPYAYLGYETIDGKTAKCGGVVNGGYDDIIMTVKWQELR